jgi:hypothetical protein
MSTVKIGRNSPCLCGSGKKYKQCCEGKADVRSKFMMKWVAIVLGGVMLLGALALLSSWSSTDRAALQPGRVWSAEHGHYH